MGEVFRLIQQAILGDSTLVVAGGHGILIGVAVMVNFRQTVTVR